MNRHHPARRSAVKGMVVGLALCLTGACVFGANVKEKTKPEAKKAEATKAGLPKRDFIIEMRQVEEGQAGGYNVSTQSQTAPWPAQAVRVRNGEKASLRMGQSLPVQWVQSVSVQTSGVSAPGVNMRSNGAGVSQATTWLNAGQSLEVTPRWAGGKDDVALDVEVQASSIGDQSASGLPKQNQSHLATSVTAPLGIWVIIASSGGAVTAKGSYGSESGADVRRTVQVRVTAP